ncbi:hypothetical protein, partial [Streptomyces griseoaurantiacus]
MTTSRPAPPGPAAAVNAMRAAMRARRRTMGASLGALPVVNLVVIEVGLALGLLLLAAISVLWPVSVAVLV